MNQTSCQGTNLRFRANPRNHSPNDVTGRGHLPHGRLHPEQWNGDRTVFRNFYFAAVRFKATIAPCCCPPRSCRGEPSAGDKVTSRQMWRWKCSPGSDLVASDVIKKLCGNSSSSTARGRSGLRSTSSRSWLLFVKVIGRHS